MRLDLKLKEQIPADIALDVDYRMELQLRNSPPDFPELRLTDD
jgi:hypothetical protein